MCGQADGPFPSAPAADLHEVAQRLLEGDELRRSMIGEVPPCPVWCTDGNTMDHDQYDTRTDTGELARFHGCYFGDGVSVLQAERLSGGMVRLDPLYIAVDVDNWGRARRRRRPCPGRPPAGGHRQDRGDHRMSAPAPGRRVRSASPCLFRLCGRATSPAYSWTHSGVRSGCWAPNGPH
jgi:hypothetical protein